MAHLTNPLATPEQLYQRTQFSSLPQDLQDIIFYTTQCLTQSAGLLLQLPQSVTAQANVLLARFWLIEPMLSYEFSDTSAATLYLTAKLSSHPVSVRDICNAYTYLWSDSSPLFRRQPSPQQQPPEPTAYTPTDSQKTSFHNRLLSLEARILYTLGFDTHVALPHPLAITYLQALEFFNHSKSEIGSLTIKYLNTALLSPQMLYLTHQPNALAVAAVYNAARDLGAKMPDTSWWEVFDCDREELGFLVVGMRSLEGWVGKMREDGKGVWEEGMVRRKDVEGEMTRRGLLRGNGDKAVDEEEEMARLMDERMATMEAQS